MLRHFAVAVFWAPVSAAYPGYSLAQGPAPSTPIDAAIAKAEAARATEAARSARTYSSTVDLKQTADQGSAIQWRVDFVEPDRFHVRQAASGQYDEWITIGQDNYRSFGAGWTKQSNEEPGFNRLFRVDKFLTLLATEPISASESVTMQERNIILAYRGALGAEFDPLSKGAMGPSEVRIWIDERTHQIVKGEVVVSSSANGKNSQITLQQSFSSYGAPIRIDPPPTQPAIARGLPDPRRPEDLEQFIDTYYQHPRPELIGRAMQLLSSSPDMNVPSAAGPTMAFFTEIFLANPGRLAEWQSTIDKQDARTKWFLARAMEWSMEGGVLRAQGHSAGINDLYWGAFFATGKSVFIERLIDEMKYADERDNAELWAAGITAKWSLASNARQHPLVRTILQSEKTTVDKKTQDLITEVLTKDPPDFQREMKEIATRQRAAGKWK